MQWVEGPIQKTPENLNEKIKRNKFTNVMENEMNEAHILYWAAGLFRLGSLGFFQLQGIPSSILLVRYPYQDCLKKIE
jgi:hypothetical protein